MSKHKIPGWRVNQVEAAVSELEAMRGAFEMRPRRGLLCIRKLLRAS